MLRNFIRKILKKEVIEDKYWFCDNHIYKGSKECERELDFIFKYYCFFNKNTYVLWLEPDPSGRAGNKIMYLGALNETDKKGNKIPVCRVEDDYRMLTTIIELKKRIGTC